MSQVVGVDPIKPFSIRGDKIVASTRKCKNLELNLFFHLGSVISPNI